MCEYKYKLSVTNPEYEVIIFRPNPEYEPNVWQWIFKRKEILIDKGLQNSLAMAKAEASGLYKQETNQSIPGQFRCDWIKEMIND